MLIRALRVLGVPHVALMGGVALSAMAVMVHLSRTLDAAVVATTAAPTAAFLLVSGWWSGLSPIVGEFELSAPRRMVAVTASSLLASSGLSATILCVFAGRIGVEGLSLAILAAAVASTAIALVTGIEFAWAGALAAAIAQSLGLLDKALIRPADVGILLGLTFLGYAVAATWLRRQA